MKKLLLFSFLLTAFNILSQTQLGSDINGLSVGDDFGTSLSLSADGSIIAIGSPFNDLVNPDGGLTTVYQFNNVTMNWEQIGNNILGESANDQSGYSVSLSDDGSILAVGAPYNDGNGIDAGHVRVYTFNTNTNTWDQLGTDIQGGLNTGGALTGDRLGYSVSLSSDGSILAIGSPFYELGDGRIHIYSYNTNTNAWDPLGSNNSIEGFGRFGFSVDLSSNGHTIAVGAIQGGTGGIRTGMVEIYNYNEITEIWEQRGSTMIGETQGSDFGHSVSLSSDGSIVAAGGPYNNAILPSSGHTRIYKYNSNIEDWQQLGSDIYGEYSAEDSGIAVSLSSNGTIIAIGARGYEDSNFSGQVRIYQYNTVTEIWELVSMGIYGESGSYAGSSVGLSSDGSILAVGSPFFNGIANSPGKVEVYGLSDILSTETIKFSSFNLYPNPASTQFTIQLNENLQLKNVNLYNQVGQLIQSSKQKVIDISNFSSGIYFVEIFTDQGKSSQKLIIE